MNYPDMQDDNEDAHEDFDDDNEDAHEDFDDDREYIDACIHATQLEESNATNEHGDEDDWDEEDLHGSRPIDDPAPADDNNEDQDEDEDM